MSEFYRLDSFHGLDIVFESYISELRKNCTAGRRQLLGHKPIEISLTGSESFDEEDIFIIGGIFPFFSDAFYQRVRDLIYKRIESYYVLEGVKLMFEGRTYYYTAVIPDTVIPFGANGKISDKFAGYLPFFRCGNNIFCNSVFAQRINDFKPYGLIIEEV